MKYPELRGTKLYSFKSNLKNFEIFLLVLQRIQGVGKHCSRLILTLQMLLHFFLLKGGCLVVVASVGLLGNFLTVLVIANLENSSR